MESYVLNDVEYDFKPLEILVPDPNYKVDEKELKKSIQKTRRSLLGQGRAEKGIYRTSHEHNEVLLIIRQVCIV